MAVANHQANYMNEICRLGIKRTAQNGFRPCKPPYGYKNLNKKAIVVQRRASFVKKAFELYATQQYSLDTLPKALYEIGCRYDLQPTKIIPKQSLASMLRNTFYAGKYKFPEIEKIIQGTHEAIVSDELFNAVQKILGENPLLINRNNLLYSKLIKCAVCNHHMIGDPKRKPSGREYLYYRCTNPKCTHTKNTNEDIIDKEVDSYFKEIRLSLIPQEVFKMVLKESLVKLNKQKAILTRSISRRYHETLAHKEAIFENDIGDLAYIEEGFEAIAEKYGDIDERIIGIEQQINRIQKSADDICSKRLYDVYVTLSKESKRKIIELVNNKFTLLDKDVKMTFKSAFRKIRRR